MLELQGRKSTGTLTDVSALTVGQYLDLWMTTEVLPNRATRTAERNEGLIRLHIKSRIGRFKLQSLGPVHVASMLAAMVEDGTSADTRKKSLVALKVALNRALKQRLIVHNPCDAVQMPKVITRDIHPLDTEQTDRMFIESSSQRLGEIFVVAATTGLRQGELFALHRRDVNLSEGVLTVRRTLEETAKGTLKLKEPKSRAGRRAVMLAAITVDALKRRMEAAAAEGLEDYEIVFPDTHGGFLRRSNFTRQTWHPVRTAAEIPKTVTFHDLRHTHASQLLAQGVHPKVVQERLGHANITMTLNTHSHLLPGLQAEAAGLIDGLFSSSEYTVSTKSAETTTQ